MLVGYYKGKRFYYNQYWMEIYEEKKGKLIKKRDFSKWENLIKWKPENNILSCRSIKEYNNKHF
jgi:hypothetical protein